MQGYEMMQFNCNFFRSTYCVKMLTNFDFRCALTLIVYNFLTVFQELSVRRNFLHKLLLFFYSVPEVCALLTSAELPGLFFSE